MINMKILKNMKIKSNKKLNLKIKLIEITLIALKTNSEVPKLSLPSTAGLNKSSAASKRSLPTRMVFPSGRW
jgi:hypothetical protein